ncbi:MAG: hypothetical protein JO127_03950 [Caulobacteraceae bacterium]|nr:hypothetical protein [Caulobacteraceae bacterium]
MFARVGVGADGRSRIVEQRNCEPTADSTPVSSIELWRTASTPPDPAAPRRAVDAQWLDLSVPEGGGRWVTIAFAPGGPGRMHHTSTLDCQVVLSGEVTLGLQDGEILLRPGDCVLIPGVEHRWTSGPEGCVLAGMLFGLPRT